MVDIQMSAMSTKFFGSMCPLAHVAPGGGNGAERMTERSKTTAGFNRRSGWSHAQLDRNGKSVGGKGVRP